MTEEEPSPTGDKESLRHEATNSEECEKEKLYLSLEKSDQEQKRKDQESQRKRYDQDTKSKGELVNFVRHFVYTCSIFTFFLLVSNQWLKVSDGVLTTFIRAVFVNNVLGLVGIVLLHFFPKR
ncbi:MAG: hypothetical protein LBG98_00340 [Puniceicoccales bacterium]|jgi:Flp pilus assembly protein TadB|nr:hypothetical protein [Puniceicoccales bacterium]